MKPFPSKITAMAAAVAALSSGAAAPSFAEEKEIQEEVITIGSRRQARSASDTVAPVDVINANDILDQASTDISDLIRTVVPSYQVNTQPISDAATIVRPANLRGLSPDNTLVLLNGKRRHRSAVISFLGGGIADGAHGPDIGVFPALGLKQVEVLRDGASSQYGADAIAGVINFQLKDNREGGTVEVKYGSTYEGDGDNVKIGANIGLPLGEEGFLSITGEFAESDGTFRSIQRDDALALIAAGNTAVSNINVNTETADTVQYWGQPEVNDDIKLFFNSGFKIAENVEGYAFGNYAERQVEGGFFFRNPTDRGGVFTGPTVDPLTGAASDTGVPSILVGDLSGDTAGDCPAGIPLQNGVNSLPDPTILAQVANDANCFSFVELFPGGFTPRFGGDSQDKSLVFGVRGEFKNGLTYDVSYTYGENEAAFFINNTVNASLGPDTPTSFRPGTYTQTDNNFNIDLTYSVPVSGFASELSIAGGIEYREEEFDIEAGDDASFALGPLATPSSAFPNGQGFASSSNGFGGFSNASAGTNTQDNTAVYIDLEADVTEAVTLQTAVRYEDFNTFGDTTNYKLGALWRAAEGATFRATFSTGFHAPTTGQANVTNITTAFNGSILVDQGTLPLNTAAGQFVNEQLGNPFTLGPEEADNFSIGGAFEIGALSLTVDFFRIEVDDRIAITDQQDFRGLLLQAGADAGVTLPADAQTSQILNALNAAGVINSADFIGSEDLGSFGFFANDFDTRTQGTDIVANLPVDLGSGSSTLALAVNYTDTEVTRRGNLSDTRLRQLEDSLPNLKGNLSFRHSADNWRVLARANFHNSYFEAHLDSGDLPIEPGGEITFDVEFGYTFGENFDVIIGAANLFDALPDENEFSGVAGARFPATAPFGFSGGTYYLRSNYNF
ncbi:TonB-dependent receptor plug domain-containing protein [Porticoccus sp. GXU_MW_L64]